MVGAGDGVEVLLDGDYRRWISLCGYLDGLGNLEGFLDGL